MANRPYSGTGITVYYDAVRCRHVAECVRGLPLVFDPRRRPWILADNEPDKQLLAEVVRRCPTGALHYALDGGPDEAPDPVTTVTAVPDGPFLVRGDLRLVLGDEGELTETRAALCRCGFSGNKPFCDGSHERIGWHSAAATDHEPESGRPHAESAVQDG